MSHSSIIAGRQGRNLKPQSRAEQGEVYRWTFDSSVLPYTIQDPLLGKWGHNRRGHTTINNQDNFPQTTHIV